VLKIFAFFALILLFRYSRRHGKIKTPPALTAADGVYSIESARALSRSP
jgi:hypothetical protein